MIARHHHRVREPRRLANRAGLAPLELTLSIPFLMLMTALMINFGFVGAWKVRAQGSARYATWRSLAVRTGEWNPPPDNWPAGSPLTSEAGPDLPQVDTLWNQPPDLTVECIRGPLLTAPSTQEILVVQGRLEMDGSVHRGRAQVSKPAPLFRGSMPGGLGRLSFNLAQDLLDHRWQFFSLGIPDNMYPRARVWYDLEHLDFANLTGQASGKYNELEQLWQQLVSSSDRRHLKTLDQDEEFIRYRGSAPDFYPRLPRECAGDVVTVRITAVEPLITRIERLPCTISQAFMGIYDPWSCGLEACGFPPSQITPLKHRYDDLHTFVQSLPSSMRCNAGGDIMARMPCTCPSPGACACPPSPVGVGY